MEQAHQRLAAAIHLYWTKLLSPAFRRHENRLDAGRRA
jgi:hypothetical protein